MRNGALELATPPVARRPASVALARAACTIVRNRTSRDDTSPKLSNQLSSAFPFRI